MKFSKHNCISLYYQGQKTDFSDLALSWKNQQQEIKKLVASEEEKDQII
jgi:hypothetical protein